MLSLSLVVGLNHSATGQDQLSKPNVIVIVTDDQGYGDMSCHGNPWVKTPNLDRLAGQSVRLEDYHVDPVCTPTRAALMTGRYCTRVGAWDVTQGRQLLRDDEVTMANVFSDSGYRTGMFGKWHLGDTRPYAPRFRGFDDVVCHLAGGVDEIGNPSKNDFFDDTYMRNGKPEHFDGYCTDVFFGELDRFIKKDSDEPFFAYLPLNAMHSPHDVAEKYSNPFLAMGHPLKRSKFYGMVVNFDENLGRLMAMLETSGMDDNTILIFMGDNGTAEGTSNTPDELCFNADMRGKKGSTYEGGHRVACFVRWPARLKADHKVHQLTSHRDWLPTLVNWCDLELPSDAKFDGQSIALLLEGDSESAKSWQPRTMFVQRQGDEPKRPNSNASKRASKRTGKYPPFSVLTEQWRMVNAELYDHATDAAQTNDVASEHPTVVADLTSQFEKHFADVFAEGRPYARFHLGGKENPTTLTVRDWHPTQGNVIWQQEQLGDDALVINGFWAIDVKQPGRYSIRLTRFPDDAPAAMRATSAKLQVGEQTWKQTISPDDVSATFEMELPAGHAVLQTWLGDAAGNERGAFFVHVSQLR